MSGVPGNMVDGRGNTGSCGQVAATQSQDHHRRRQRELWLLVAVLLSAVLIHHATYASITKVWWQSQTFVHGTLIFPISVYLVWRRWPILRAIDLQPYYPGLAGLLFVSAGWSVSDVLSLQVGKQFMAVALLPLLVVTLAGTAFARAISFPLAYLVFAVPFGEAAIPYLIEFTATFTVSALELTGFPVYREGAFFSIPAGDFEVAKACSGIRYLLASLALGTLYGYLVFDKLKKRLAFFVFALLLPIAANGLRAYGIVLFAHYSEMRLAIGIDHFIFGWMFFGFVMVVMFWIGDRFRDRPLVAVALNQDSGPNLEGRDTSLLRFAPAIALALLAIFAGPGLAELRSATDPTLAAAGLPQQAGRWRPAAATGDWHPAFDSATFSLQGGYELNSQRIDLAVYRYDTQGQDAELANADNEVADRTDWRFGQTAKLQIRIEGSEPVAVHETIIHRAGISRLVWFMAEVNGEPVASDVATKWKEAMSLLASRPPVSAAIIVSVPIIGRDEAGARLVLESFLSEAWKAIHDCLYAERPGPAACESNAAGQEDMTGSETGGPAS